MPRSLKPLLLLVALLPGPAAVASGQTAARSSAQAAARAPAQPTGQSVTTADIDRLQDGIFQAGTEVWQVRTRDADGGAQLQAELDELHDEVIYLKVKLRKERTVTRTEYAGARDRIERLRTRVRAAAATATPAPAPAQVAAPPAPPLPTAGAAAVPASAPAPDGTRVAADVPAGTELEVRLLDSLSSGTARVEDRFEAATLADLLVGGRVVIPAGSLLRGLVTAVEPGSRTNRTARLTVSFDQVTIGTAAHPIRATVTEAIKGDGVKGEAGRLGVGAGVGAILGGILGGGKGAVAGILIGGGGTMAATEGKDVQLEQGAVLRVRFDAPATLAR